MPNPETTSLARPLCNRSATGEFLLPADGWFHIVPRGEWEHDESGTVQVVDDAALASMVNRFTEEKAKSKNFPGLRVDFEHFSYDPEKPSNAAGWIEDLQNRADGLWANIRLSTDGEAAIKGGNYRLISPAWLSKDAEKLGKNRVRPLRLDSAGLTNNPNMRGMIPLSNRAENNPQSANPNPPKPLMKSIAQALGLSPDAAEDAVLAETLKLQKQAGLVPALQNRVTELETAHATITNRCNELLGQQVEADLEKFSNRFAADKRDAWKQALLANRSGTLALLESIAAPKAEDKKPDAPKPMHNRSAAQPPAGSPADEDAKRKKEEARAAKIANRADEIQRTNPRMNSSTAFKRAALEFTAD